MAAKTVFTFVDREKTAEASASANPTEAALAQLYAHIQSLPESSKKRKLIKQFNKENGQGTPQLIMGSNRTGRARHRTGGSKPRQRSRSLGDSIKVSYIHQDFFRFVGFIKPVYNEKKICATETHSCIQ